MKKINFEFNGVSYLIVTNDQKTRIGIRGNTTLENDNNDHCITPPNILIVTRANADVLFILKGNEEDNLTILTAQNLYDKYKYQWFEPLADNYRELLFVNDADYVKEAYKVFTWEEIEKFASVDRPSLSFYKGLDGDWKKNPLGGDKYLMVLVNEIPYWTDGVGQIPFAVDTYRSTKDIRKTVEIGITWGDGTYFGDVDYSNEYDNYFVLRGALFASKKFTYDFKKSGLSYPQIISVETINHVNSNMLSVAIKESEVGKYGIWKK
jgi:hypothetical protein